MKYTQDHLKTLDMVINAMDGIEDRVQGRYVNKYGGGVIPDFGIITERRTRLIEIREHVSAELVDPLLEDILTQIFERKTEDCQI